MEAKAMDRQNREKRKSRFISSMHVKQLCTLVRSKEMTKGQKVFVKQNASSSPALDSRPNTVTEVQRMKEAVRRREEERTSNKAEGKVVKDMAEHLQPQSSRWEQAEDTDSIVDIQLGLDAGAPGGEDQQQHKGVSEPVYKDSPDTSVRRSDREVEVPERFDVLLEQLSPGTGRESRV